MMKSRNRAKTMRMVIIWVVIGAIFSFGYSGYRNRVREKEILRQMVERLQADSRIAEVIVTAQEYDPGTRRQITTIKFLEFDSLGNPLAPLYFSFFHNIIQFQSLVVRFQDHFITSGDPFRGKSVYLFWKAFVLDGPNTQEYIITPVDAVPSGYKIQGPRNRLEEDLWKRFWEYALNPQKAASQGVKNAQIEAPGTKFVPGILYTLKIEHDGGIRIDASEIPPILRGERILP